MSLQLDNEEAYSLCQLGYLLYLRGRDREAQALFDGLTRLLGQSKQGAYAWYILGLIARRRGEMQRAVEALQQSLGIDRDNPEARLAMAEVLLLTQQAQPARQWLATIQGESIAEETLRRARALERRWF